MTVCVSGAALVEAAAADQLPRFRFRVCSTGELAKLPKSKLLLSLSDSFLGEGSADYMDRYQ